MVGIALVIVAVITAWFGLPTAGLEARYVVAPSGEFSAINKLNLL